MQQQRTTALKNAKKKSKNLIFFDFLLKIMIFSNPVWGCVILVVIYCLVFVFWSCYLVFTIFCSSFSFLSLIFYFQFRFRFKVFVISFWFSFFLIFHCTVVLILRTRIMLNVPLLYDSSAWTIERIIYLMNSHIFTWQYFMVHCTSAVAFSFLLFFFFSCF